MTSPAAGPRSGVTMTVIVTTVPLAITPKFQVNNQCFLWEPWTTICRRPRRRPTNPTGSLIGRYCEGRRSRI
jgi:hypothetical protein